MPAARADGLGHVRAFGTCAEDGHGRIPATLDEALLELERSVDRQQRALLRDNPPIEQSSNLPALVRRCWHLWGDSPLQRWFAERGVSQAEDVSRIVVTSLHRRLAGEKIDLDGQIKSVRQYWAISEEARKRTADPSVAPRSVTIDGDGQVTIACDHIPKCSSLLDPLIEQTHDRLVACFQAGGGQSGGNAIETSIGIATSATGQITDASVRATGLPDRQALCFAEAMRGASIPELRSTSATLILVTYHVLSALPPVRPPSAAGGRSLPPTSSKTLRCGTPEYVAVKSAALAFCRDHPQSDHHGYCPFVGRALRNCQQRTIYLERWHDCHGDGAAKLCHDFISRVGYTGEGVPILALVWEERHWRVVDIEYDSYEMP